MLIYRRKQKTWEDKHKEWQGMQIDTGARLRIFVGEVGPRAFSSQGGGGGGGGAAEEAGPPRGGGGGENGFLKGMDRSGKFRDALLQYANRYWAKELKW
eukprot:SAG11_NODE_542_length_8640_cov_5.667603_9_plen_99_part_00